MRIFALPPTYIGTYSLPAQFKARTVYRAAHTASVTNGEIPMKIKLTSVYVDNQEKALRFYTDVLGFRIRSTVRVVQRW
jgi:hypothetical protein